MTAAVAGSSQQPATLAAQLRLIACAIKSMEFGSAGTAHAGTAHLKYCLSDKTCVFQAFLSLAFRCRMDTDVSELKQTFWD